jgi:hypothetical protein
MDWKECCGARMVKETREDKNKIKAMKKIASDKFKGAEFLPAEYYYSTITLLYDTLRIYLECLALEKGYKIYNHDCYTAFLKEILKDSSLGDEFDKFRIIRNAINYYGREMSSEEGKSTIQGIKSLISKIEKKYFGV